MSGSAACAVPKAAFEASVLPYDMPHINDSTTREDRTTAGQQIKRRLSSQA